MVLVALPILARPRIAQLLPDGGRAGEGVS
jgi:hypothetical protein